MHCNHEPTPFTYGVQFPDLLVSLPQEEWDTRAMISEDLVVIDGEQFFIRGNLSIPIRDHEQSMNWGIWFSLSHGSFTQTVHAWETPGRENIVKPAFSWVSNNLPSYPSTREVMANVHMAPIGNIPHAVLNEEQDHPLSRDFHHGISMERAMEIDRIVNGR